MIDGEIYVVNALNNLKEMIYAKVTSIDGVDINTIVEKLSTLISHENDSWITALLPNKLNSPFHLYGLGVVKDKSRATFTVEKDGVKKDYTVEACYYTKKINCVNNDINPVFMGQYDKNYTYQYLPDSKALYFQYNSCQEMREQSFQDFNDKMFQCMEENEVDRIVLDVRCNTGGDSEVLNPFTEKIASYLQKHPNVKVYILIGRRTFSGGMFAIYRTKEAVLDALLVGESTGGAIDFFGDIESVELPNSHNTIYYSSQYFEFSKEFNYKNKGVDTCEPDVIIQPTIDDYRNGKDLALDYVLEN